MSSNTLLLLVIILLNTFIIIALNRVLQSTSTILLTSLAVADLLVGAINMPLSATIDVLILQQVSFEHICFLVNVPGVYSIYFFSFSSLYHLTAIAWERNVAVVKWMDYKVIVTKSRVKKLATMAWLGSVFTVLPPLLIQVAGGDTEIVEYSFFAWIELVTIALITIAYFYVMVYRGIRKRKINEIRRVTALVKAKMESKIAKTTFLLTSAVICSFFPAIVFYILGEAFPILRTSAYFRFWEILIQINSLLDPLLYCYRDRRFRNGLLELLRKRKRRAIHTTEGAGRNFKRKDPFGTVEDALQLKFVAKSSHLMRAASCDLAVVSDCVHGKSYEMMLKRSMSTPTLQECHNLRSLDVFQQPQPSSIVVTTSALIR